MNKLAHSKYDTNVTSTWKNRLKLQIMFYHWGNQAFKLKVQKDLLDPKGVDYIWQL